MAAQDRQEFQYHQIEDYGWEVKSSWNEIVRRNSVAAFEYLKHDLQPRIVQPKYTREKIND